MRFSFLAIRSIVTLVLFTVSYSLIAATPNQLDMFNKLSPAQQQKVMGLMASGDMSSLIDGLGAKSNMRSVKKQQKQIDKPSILSLMPSPEEEVIDSGLKPEDSLIVFFELKPKTDSKVFRTAAPEFVPDNAQQLYSLDKLGRINIDGIGFLGLAGLTEEQAAARINLEPALTYYRIKVMHLPLKKFGVAELKPFGYDFFELVNSEISMSEMSMPVPLNYTLGPGDQVDIQLFGKENQSYLLEVSRDNTLSLPGIGVFPVSGLKFEEFKKGLERRIKRQYIGVDAFITLGELRSIQIFVVGEVKQPGSYAVSSLSTITNALSMAFGINEIGSLRNIQLKRNGKLIQTLDLYDLLMHGNTQADVRLRPGDVVHVPIIERSVSIAGEVRRPAIYELKNEKNLIDIFKLAGGLLPTALKSKIKLHRIIDIEKKLIDLNYAKLKDRNLKIQTGDSIVVESVLDRQQNVVWLKGEVVTPGRYQWQPDLKLTDVIGNIRNIKPSADAEYVLIKRYASPTFELRVISANLRKAFTTPLGHENIYLMPGDEVTVFSLSDKRILEIKPIVEQLTAQSFSGEPAQVVRITGQVRGKGTYPLEEQMRVSDLIIAGGRLRESAYTMDAELTRFISKPGQPRKLIHLNINLSKALAGNHKENILLQPFDLLNIKEIPLWKEADKVELVGEVKFPGSYTIEHGESLRHLLNRAGNLTDFSYPEGAVFVREDLRIREQEQLDTMAANLEAELASISLERSGDPTQIQTVGSANQLLTKLRSTNAAGRLVIDLGAIVAENSIAEKIILRGGDKLFIPSKMQEVSVIGQVFHPTSHLFRDDLNSEDYINLSGGMTKKADDASVYIVRANGAVQLAEENWLEQTPDLRPGDTIVVPLDAERISSLKLWGSISQILYQLGLSAAAWNTVGLFNVK